MKLKQVLVVLLILCHYWLYSQMQYNRPKPSLELAYSTNSLLQFEDKASYRYSFGLSLMRVWRKQERISINSGISFNCNRFYTNSAGRLSNVVQSIYSFSLPLMARLNIDNFFVEAGPSFTLVPVWKANGTELVNPHNGSVYRNNSSEYISHRPVSIGLVLGTGIRCKIKASNFLLGGGLNLDLPSILTDKKNVEYHFLSLKTALLIN